MEDKIIELIEDKKIAQNLYNNTAVRRAQSLPPMTHVLTHDQVVTFAIKFKDLKKAELRLWLERRVQDCKDLEGMDKEIWAFIQVLKHLNDHI